jgi:hypothetical protein
MGSNFIVYNETNHTCFDEEGLAITPIYDRNNRQIMTAIEFNILFSPEGDLIAKNSGVTYDACDEKLRSLLPPALYEDAEIAARMCNCFLIFCGVKCELPIIECPVIRRLTYPYLPPQYQISEETYIDAYNEICDCDH